ncbi:hypothetical protein SprV_0702344000 [Sparganum proliferum]
MKMRELSREERLLNARKKLEKFRNSQGRLQNASAGAQSDQVANEGQNPPNTLSTVNAANALPPAVINHCVTDAQDSGAHYQFTPTTQFSPDVQQFSLPSPSCAFSSPPLTTAASVEYMPHGPANRQEYVNNGQNSVPSGDSYSLGDRQLASYDVYPNIDATNSTQNCHSGMPTGATEVAAQISQHIKHLVSHSPPFDSGGGGGMSTDSVITLNASQPDQALTGYRVLANASPSALSHQSLPAVLSAPTANSAASTEYYRHRVPSSVSALSADRPAYSPSVTPVGQFASTSATPILIRELQQRNVDLATLLEQRNETHDRAVAQVAALREQLQRERLSADEKRASLETATQRELAKARDQVRAHAQTVGALIAEKTELQAKLTHTERLAEQRLKELEETNLKLRETKQRVKAVEEEARLASSNSQNVDIAKQEAMRQLERCRENLEREKEARNSLQSELRETEARLFARELDVSKLTLSVEDLKRQLEVAVAFSNNRGLLPNQTPASAPASLECARCEALKARIHDLESGSTHSTAERHRLESHYKACVTELEKQNGDLQFRLQTVTESKAEIQKTLEELRRQMTEKESQLTDVVSELERLKLVSVQQQSVGNSAAATTDVANQQAIAAAVSPAKEAEEAQRLDEEAIVNSELYQKLQALCNSLQREATQAGQKVAETEERLAEVESRLQDQAQVLATANSERAALSRAVDQNRKIKEHLTALQNALDIVSAEKDDISEELTRLRGLTAEQSEALRTTEGSLASANAKCAELEAEVSRLLDATQPVQPKLPNPTTPSTASPTDCHDAAVSVVAHCQNSTTQTVDESCASSTTTTQTDSDVKKLEESITGLQNELTESRTAYAQLEARFLAISERLSRSDEKNSRLEATVAQLEMESSTIGEYITLFAHRRMLATKRARLREALLARLVRDRRTLRKRLSTLMASAAAGEVTNDVSASADEHHDHSHAVPDHHCESPLPASDALQRFREELSNFLADLDNAEPVDLNRQDAEQTGVDDEEVALADASRPPEPKGAFGTNDVRMAEEEEGDALSHRSAASLRRARTESATNGVPFNLEDQLRLLAVHDCPHCECCSGSLLVV